MKLPYSFRDNQEETVESIKSALAKRNHIVLESPTGSGKTFTSLAAALPFAKKNVPENCSRKSPDPQN